MGIFLFSLLKITVDYQLLIYYSLFKSRKKINNLYLYPTEDVFTVNFDGELLIFLIILYIYIIYIYSMILILYIQFFLTIYLCFFYLLMLPLYL